MIRYSFVLLVACQIICEAKSSIIAANNSISIISNNTLKKTILPGEEGPTFQPSGKRLTTEKCGQQACPHRFSGWNTIRGHLDAKTLQIGYYNMLLIPSGAINVTINAAVQTRHYLEVRNDIGYFHLNGNRLIDSSKAIPFAGCNWRYEKGPDRFGAPDRLTCLGPIKESVYLAMIVKNTNASIQYEYSVLSAANPINGQQRTNSTQEDLRVSAHLDQEQFVGIYVPPDCTDNQLLAKCDLIVAGHFCNHKNYRKFCCRSCTLAGQINVSNESINGQQRTNSTQDDLRVLGDAEQEQFVAPVMVAMYFPKGNNVDRNSNFTITCTVDGYPKPVVSWFKDGQIMVPTERIHITDENLLVLTGTIPSDSGQYKCLAENEHSEAFQEQILRVEGIYVPADCTDNQLLVKCDLIVSGHFCNHKNYRKFCCRSCTLAGQINVSKESQ